MPIIWLNKKEYPNNQKGRPFSTQPDPSNNTVCSIKKDYVFNKKVRSLNISFFADSNCYIFCNDQLVSNANMKPSGDFLFQERLNPDQYIGKKELVLEKSSEKISFFAMASLGAVRLYDISSGFGGFYLKADVYFEDGSRETIESDESWLIKLEKGFYDVDCFDQNKDVDDYKNAEIKNNPVNLILCDGPVPIEEEIKFDNKFIFASNSRSSKVIDLPMIYSAYLEVEIKCKNEVEASIELFEYKNETGKVALKAFKDKKLRFLHLYSIGKLKVSCKNKGINDAEVIVHVYHSHIFVPKMGNIETPNRKLNSLFEKCKFSTINCSQNVILDSPKHCEPSASCSGDYQIISLTHGIFTGDYSLAKHTLRANAQLFKRNHGRCANSSYALIFVSWLWKIYFITGDKKLLEDCIEGVEAVNKEFNTYVAENGLIEKPYNYCFMDWLVIDGFNLFCPPKALGQSVYSMHYYDCVLSTSKIYKELGNDKQYKKYSNRAKRLKKAINELLFDKERGLYIEGLSTPNMPDTKVYEKWNYPPKNADHVYYRKHANALAAAYGISNKKVSKQVINGIFNELKDCEIQPYFYYFVAQGVHNAGLDKKYAMKIIKEWLIRFKEKDKGLLEGFFKPHPSYIFDYSHGWGCSPYLIYIVAASGIEILESGMKKVKLNFVSKLNKNVSYDIGTPYGFISVKNGEIISKPKEIEIIV